MEAILELSLVIDRCVYKMGKRSQQKNTGKTKEGRVQSATYRGKVVYSVSLDMLDTSPTEVIA